MSNSPVYYNHTKPVHEVARPYVSHLKAKRDALLAKTDWTQTVDAPLSDAKKAEWATYRQALRDLPSSESPSDFPQPPSA